MPSREERQRQRRCAPPAEPRGEDPDEVTAKEKLLAESRGQRHPPTSTVLSRARQHGGERSGGPLPQTRPRPELRARVATAQACRPPAGNKAIDVRPPAVGHREAERLQDRSLATHSVAPTATTAQATEGPCRQPRPRPSRIGLRPPPPAARRQGSQSPARRSPRHVGRSGESHGCCAGILTRNASVRRFERALVSPLGAFAGASPGARARLLRSGPDRVQAAWRSLPGTTVRNSRAFRRQMATGTTSSPRVTINR